MSLRGAYMSFARKGSRYSPQPSTARLPSLSIGSRGIWIRHEKVGFVLMSKCDVGIQREVKSTKLMR